MASVAARVAAFFGLKRNVVILLIAIVVIGAGEELWMRFVPKYLQALGAAPFVIGLYDAIKTLLGAIYAWPGGIVTCSGMPRASGHISCSPADCRYPNGRPLNGSSGGCGR